jgi:hypothetical protein
MRAQSLLKKVSIAFAGLAIATCAHAMKLKSQNLQQLTQESQSIIAGEVVKVVDGFDSHNRPYTEVTINVASSVKGNHKEDSTFTFRQFGLTKPRSMGNGKVYLGVSPEGFAKWHEGEQVVAFMYKPASITGFQTTAGMAQGKFIINDGKVSNQFANAGLFDNIETSSLTDEEANLITNPAAMDATAFFSIVGKLAGAQ